MLIVFFNIVIIERSLFVTQNAVSRLLVIGNGFDLKCDLKSKFEDYYNSKVDKVDMVKILNKMNEEFNEGNTSTEILQADVLHVAGFQRSFGNLNDIIKINFNDKVDCKINPNAVRTKKISFL